MSFEQQDVERKVLSILKILDGLKEPAGSRIIAKHLPDHGVYLGERAVRYHLRLMDERELTRLVGNRDGRVITEKGLNEIKNALVKDKVGFAISRIEQLAFRTSFDYEKLEGNIPVNISLFPQSEFKNALTAMKPAFKAGYCVSQLVAIASEGQHIGGFSIPEGKIGFATVCSVVTNGTLLKAGIPMDSRFGGILEIKNTKPVRFTEIIHYDGCSLDPSEIFIKAKMTSVRDAISTGNGEILANFREIPAICIPIAEEVLDALKRAGLGSTVTKGNISEPVCEIPVEPNKVGLILPGGLNPVAAAQEAGIESSSQSMATVVDYRDLVKFESL